MPLLLTTNGREGSSATSKNPWPLSSTRRSLPEKSAAYRHEELAPSQRVEPSGSATCSVLWFPLYWVWMIFGAGRHSRLTRVSPAPMASMIEAAAP